MTLGVTAQTGTYCITDLYNNNHNCLMRVNQPGDTIWFGVIEDFSIWGEGSSVLQDLNTGCPTFTPGVPFSPGFSDRTHLPPVEVSPGKEYDARIFVKSGSAFHSTNNIRFNISGLYMRADFNQNFVFDTAGESLIKPVPDSTAADCCMFGPSFGAVPLPYFFKIRIPANAPLGIFRMRVREGQPCLDLNAMGKLDSLCKNYGSGEVHDYLIKVVQPQSVRQTALLPSAISVRPQPATAEARLQLPSGERGTVLVQDMAGRLVLRREAAGTEQEMIYSVSGWPQGHYFIRFQGEKMVAATRLLVGL